MEDVFFKLFEAIFTYPEVSSEKSAKKCQRHIKWKAWIMIGLSFITSSLMIVSFFFFQEGTVILLFGKSIAIWFMVVFSLISLFYAAGVLHRWKTENHSIESILSKIPSELYSGECVDCSTYRLKRDDILKVVENFIVNISQDKFTTFLLDLNVKIRPHEDNLSVIYEHFGNYIRNTFLCVISNPQYFTDNKEQVKKLSEYFLNFKNVGNDREILRLFCASAIKKDSSNNSNEYKRRSILFMHYIILNMIGEVKTRVIFDDNKNGKDSYVDYVIGMSSSDFDGSYSVRKLYISYEDPQKVSSTEDKVLVSENKLLIDVLEKDFHKRWNYDKNRNISIACDIGDSQSIFYIIDKLKEMNPIVTEDANTWRESVLRGTIQSIEDINTIQTIVSKNNVFNELRLLTNFNINKLKK